MPRWSEYHRFGHEAEGCLRTYILAVGHQETDPVNKMTINADEAESTAASSATAVLSPVCNDRDLCTEEQDRKSGKDEDTTEKTPVITYEKSEAHQSLKLKKKQKNRAVWKTIRQQMSPGSFRNA